MSDEEVPRRGAAAPRAVPGKGPAPVEPLERLLSRRAVASGGDPEVWHSLFQHCCVVIVYAIHVVACRA
jgi:hypothetical protein